MAQRAARSQRGVRICETGPDSQRFTKASTPESTPGEENLETLAEMVAGWPRPSEPLRAAMLVIVRSVRFEWRSPLSADRASCMLRT